MIITKKDWWDILWWTIIAFSIMIIIATGG